MVAASELPVNTGASAVNMANTIMGDGVTVVSASYTGDNRSSGTYSNGDSTSPNATPGDTGVILSTGYVRDFTQSNGSSNHSSGTSTNTSGVNNDAGFNAIAGGSTYDAAILDIDFIPTGDTLTMQFTLSSEEYPEYWASYSDIVGVWINGNYVEMDVGNGDADVQNINSGSNENLFLDNTNDAYNTEMDGLTITLTLTIPVNPGVVNSIRIGVADQGDSSYDTNLLIAGNSMQTTLVAVHDTTVMYANGTRIVDALDNDINSTGGTLTITHINGVVVTIGDTVTLPSGETVTLNADGTMTVVGDDDVDVVHFSYEVESSTGGTDVGFVTVNTIPCFVAGTMILTPEGEVAVESLQAGDLVMTHDDGPQPLRWIGQRTVDAVDSFAPVRINAGTFGDHRELLVSPQHRVLIRDSLAELLFGETEVLVAAKDLLNDKSVRIQEGGDVTYVHLLFDRHQVIFSEGLTTESFLPGPQTSHAFEQDTIDEICALFPEIDRETGLGYSPSARRTLRGYEAKILTQNAMAA